MRKNATIIAIIALSAALIYYFNPESIDKSPVLDEKSEKSLHIENFYLKNGMRVIFVPNHRVPAISHILWLKIGAADDPVGKSGLAHYLEHLMFKGTPRVPEGEYSKRIEALGGEHNAFTGADFTGYYVNIAKEHLETVMKLESDRFQNLAPSEEMYQKERAVILEERKLRVDNRPGALLSEQVQATLLQHHPYRIPIIGWAHEMEALTLKDAMAFYREHYHAGNMVLVVSGDVGRAKLQKLAERYYGSMPQRAATRKPWLKEPPHRGHKRISMRDGKVKQPVWSRHYIAPSLKYGKTEHAIPLMLLEHWLGGGKTSLLYQHLVEKMKLASSASASYSVLSIGPSRLAIRVTPNPGVSMQTIERAVNDVLVQVTSKAIDEERLERTKTLLKADAIYAREGLQPMAHLAGYLASMDVELKYLKNWESFIESVTSDQILKAAKAVIRPESSVTATLLPKEQAPAEQKEKGDE
ncbi:MAG: insulinase family protein [Rickettsiales bacterium]|nr:insulinase family protein [Rickettsiales bacterium]